MNGIYNLIRSAMDKEQDKDHTFFLQGDLIQMSNQKSFLIAKGFSVAQNDVYPCLKTEDIAKALRAIWFSKIEGWWHYKKEYIEHGICTEEEFKSNNTIW